MHTFRILVLGGATWPDCSVNSLRSSSTDLPHSAKFIAPFLKAADWRIMSLESALVGSDSNGLTAAMVLKHLGIDAVSLSNKGVFGHGTGGFTSTLQTVSELGIEWFGAGRNLLEASEPHRITLPERVGGGQVDFHGSLEYSARLDKEYGVYANENSAGCSPLRVSAVPEALSSTTPGDSFQVALPHWGDDTAWRNYDQFKLAHRFLKKDYDLILGHGSRCTQEVHRKQQRWVVYGLGDAPSCTCQTPISSPFSQETWPFSMWAMLEVNRHRSRRWVTLKLYPVTPGDGVGHSQWRPASSGEFEQVVQNLADQPARPWRYDNPAQSTDIDKLGRFIELDLGEWPAGQRPSRIELPAGDKDPADWPLRGPSTCIEDRVLRLRKHLAVGLLASQAETEGGTATWLAQDLALLDVGAKSMLAFRYSAHESALGSAIVKDKVLTARVLESAGISTPRTVQVHSAEEAVREADSIAGPVVIKPRDGIQSKGVSTGLVGTQEVREAYAYAREHGTEVILQPHIEMSEELRVMASPQEAVAVNGRMLPHVVGDGCDVSGER